MEHPTSHLPQGQDTSPQRLVVGITGASGAVLGIRMLEALRSTAIETHLVLSESARLTILQETDWKVEDVLSLADVSYHFRDIGAAIASGSFRTMGMVTIPCSVKTLSAVANSYTDDLISRAADVTLKEGRPLILVVRETPYHPGHLRLMCEAATAGAVIFPPIPAFYLHLQSLDDMVNTTVGRILSFLGVETNLHREWRGSAKE
jgi:flavin prenyltransferase